MISLLTWFCLMASMVGCSGGFGTASVDGDVVAGEKLFRDKAVPACATCHSLDARVTVLGPSLARIGAEAGSRVAGQSAEDYIRTSIVKPEAHKALGFAANIMFAGYGAQLSNQEIEDLVAYLLTLR